MSAFIRSDKGTYNAIYNRPSYKELPKMLIIVYSYESTMSHIQLCTASTIEAPALIYVLVIAMM